MQKFIFLDMMKMNEDGFREFQILDELQAQGDEVEWPLNAGEGEADEEEVTTNITATQNRAKSTNTRVARKAMNVHADTRRWRW